MAEKKKYVYCDILPANYSTSYFYICDFDVRPGDIVVIPIRSNNIEKAALVLDVKEYTEAHAPYPPDMTKHVLRHFGDNESSELIKQKAKVEAEKAVRFRAQEQMKKLAVKESLLKYGVGKKKIDDSKKKLKALIESIPNKNEYMEDFIDDLSDGFRLSADGKTVIEFRNKKQKEK